jgi:hypothetical protein
MRLVMIMLNQASTLIEHGHGDFQAFSARMIYKTQDWSIACRMFIQVPYVTQVLTGECTGTPKIAQRSLPHGLKDSKPIMSHCFRSHTSYPKAGLSYPLTCLIRFIILSPTHIEFNYEYNTIQICSILPPPRRLPQSILEDHAFVCSRE